MAWWAGNDSISSLYRLEGQPAFILKAQLVISIIGAGYNVSFRVKDMNLQFDQGRYWLNKLLHKSFDAYKLRTQTKHLLAK